MWTYDKQEQMAKMKDNEERIEKKLKEVSNENKKLTEPLKEAREQVADLQRQLTNYNKDKVSLSVRYYYLYYTKFCSSLYFSFYLLVFLYLYI